MVFSPLRRKKILFLSAPPLHIGPEKTIMGQKYKGGTAMDHSIVYFSRTGNTARLAEALREALGPVSYTHLCLVVERMKRKPSKYF